MMIITVIACIVLFLLGYFLGILQKGLHINIVYKPVETVDKPQEYNKSLAHLLPAEVKNYYQSTNGQNNF